MLPLPQEKETSNRRGNRDSYLVTRKPVLITVYHPMNPFPLLKWGWQWLYSPPHAVFRNRCYTKILVGGTLVQCLNHIFCFASTRRKMSHSHHCLGFQKTENCILLERDRGTWDHFLLSFSLVIWEKSLTHAWLSGIFSTFLVAESEKVSLNLLFSSLNTPSSLSHSS